MQLFDDGAPLIGRKGRARLERECIVVHGEVLDLGDERLQVGIGSGQLVVIPRACRISGKVELVGDIDAGVDVGNVGVKREVQNLRQQDNAVEVDVPLSF